MKIYTKKGDLGETGLFGGARVPKDHERVVAYGEVDELVSLLGLIRSTAPDKELLALLGDIQLDLFLLSSELATPTHKKTKGELLEDADVESLEAAIDRCDEELPPLTSFILPGGSPTSARLQWARTVCRRAERAVVSAGQSHELRPVLLRYLNRLSDLLFSLGRLANVREGVAEVLISELRAQRSARAAEAGSDDT